MDYPSNWSTTPGIYPNIPNAVYHADRKAISRSWLTKKTPAHLVHWLNEPDDDFSEVLSMGRAFHTGLFEPHLWSENVAVMPDWNLRTKQGKLDRDLFLKGNAGKAILRQGWDKNVQGMLASVRRHDRAMALVKSCSNFEVTFVWQDTFETRKKIQDYTGQETDPAGATDAYLKCRLDAYGFAGSDGSLGTAVDLKSTRDADADKFARDGVEYGYTIQAPFYMDGAIANNQPISNFVFLCVENRPPHCVAQYRIEESDIEVGRKEYQETLAWACKVDVTAETPQAGYPDRVINFSWPFWYHKKMEN